MSSRWYPIYQKGNPQIRIFLPNLFMKLIKNEHKIPKNVVTFHVAMQMTRIDIKNYLEKIYKVPVVKVDTRIKLGQIKKSQLTGVMERKDDEKIAYVHLPADQSFEFPNLFDSEAKDKEEETAKNNLETMRDEQNKFLERNKDARDMPGWYSL